MKRKGHASEIPRRVATEVALLGLATRSNVDRHELVCRL